jgi:hypothetical protein
MNSGLLAWTWATLTLMLLVFAFMATHPTGATMRCRDAVEAARR